MTRYQVTVYVEVEADSELEAAIKTDKQLVHYIMSTIPRAVMPDVKYIELADHGDSYIVEEI
jgi:hypothetical protein